MKSSISILSFLLLFSSLVYGQTPQGHSIKVSLKDYHSGKLYLGNYFGKQTFIVDSADMNAKGTAVFQGKDTLPGGIYFILLPQKKKYFELLVDRQQHFSIKADTADRFRHNVFTGSEDNELFSAYNAFLSDQQQRVDSARRAGADSVALQQIQHTIGKDIHIYRQDFLQKHPHALLALIFRAMQDPVVPENKTNDSTFAYHYFRAHYWDQINFKDNRIVRTPILETRLQRYFTQLVPPVADSINQAADALLAKAKENQEVFKYVLWWLTYNYETSPYMGMDAVFVHLVEKYYMTGEAYWLTKEQTKKIVDRASQIAPNLIGNIAPNLSLQTIDMKPISLWSIKSKYTVLVFWDPTCGHCQIVVPELDSAYEKKWKNEGVTMVGVLAGGTKEQWKDFIQKNNLQDWMNVWDPDKKTNYRRLYDVYMTPVTYLLDDQKKIIAKKLDVKQIEEFLQHLQQKSLTAGK